MNENIEQELRRALGRIPAPDGFTERVMARVPEQGTWGLRWWYAAVAAVMVVALLIGGFERTRQQQAQRAERDVVFALALAAEKLQKVNVKLEHSSPELRVEQRQEKRYE